MVGLTIPEWPTPTDDWIWLRIWFFVLCSNWINECPGPPGLKKAQDEEPKSSYNRKGETLGFPEQNFKTGIGPVYMVNYFTLYGCEF